MTHQLQTSLPPEYPSTPGPGRSLATVTEERAIHVRTAVETVESSFRDQRSVLGAWESVFASRWHREHLVDLARMSSRAAWGLVSMRVVGRSAGSLEPRASLRDAEAWFLGSLRPPKTLSRLVDSGTDREAVRALEELSYDEALRDLLPYVLDSLGPGSRASVIRDPGTAKTRNARRAAGVFYTPYDVARYIARESLNGLNDARSAYPLILDPACGSGIFLKAALDTAVPSGGGDRRLRFAQECLYGIDLDPLAVEAACFVLLRECLDSTDGQPEVAPWSLWHCLRCNFWVGDALEFRVAPSEARKTVTLKDLRTALARSFRPPAKVTVERTGLHATSRLFSPGRSLGQAFPHLAHGADTVIGNPPYATIGDRKDTAGLLQRFTSLPSQGVSRCNYFPLFVEMMWRLANRRGSSSGMVVPLSIASSRRAQVVALRRALVEAGGRWRFAFFDREPHALFGEEVKTRSAIVFRTQCAAQGRRTLIETGPLRKWTSRQRSELFKNIRFTRLKSVAIVAGIPKVEGSEAAAVFSRVMVRSQRLHQMCRGVHSYLPRETAEAGGRSLVFVAGTAYNFLGVFRPHERLPPQRAPWSANKVLALELGTEEEADRVYAYLGSRIAYWLWHVMEDGFHVTRSFVLNLPLTDAMCNEGQRAELADAGARLWKRVQSQQVVSVNGGRQTVSYRPYGSGDVRDEIDSIVLQALGLPESFGSYLRSFTRSVVVVDEQDSRRDRSTIRSASGGGGEKCPG